MDELESWIMGIGVLGFALYAGIALEKMIVMKGSPPLMLIILFFACMIIASITATFLLITHKGDNYEKEMAYCTTK